MPAPYLGLHFTMYDDPLAWQRGRIYLCSLQPESARHAIVPGLPSQVLCLSGASCRCLQS